MLDRFVRPLIDPPLHRLALAAVRLGWHANAVTIAGFAIGLACVPLVAAHYYPLALLPLAASRLLDGLDGAVARIRGPSDFGGYIDIVGDFIFYAAFVAAFAAAEPANHLPAALLLVAFMGTGTSFLAWAILAAKHGLQTDAQGKKSFFYSAGLIEGSETIGFFVICCLWPGYFPVLAYVFAGLCAITIAGRVALAHRQFGGG